MATPTLTILMTVYNGRRYLPAAVESILNQTWTDYEFLISDDGSTDGTWELLQEYAGRDPRLTLYRNPQNIGITRSMNLLFALAQGEYITRHDADDISLPDRLEKQQTYLQAHPEIGVLATRVQYIDSDGRPLPATPFFNVGYTNQEIQEQLLVDNCICQGSAVMRRRCLEQIGYYDETLEQAEDYDLWLRLAEITQITKLDTPLYHYRHHPTSITRRRHHQMVYDHARVQERTIFRRFGPTPPAAQLAAIARRYLKAAILKYDAAANDPTLARAALDKVLALQPAVLSADPAQLESLLTAYTHAHPAANSLAFITDLFAALPPDARLRRTCSRWLAKVHMRELFAAARQGDRRKVQANLWPGLRHDPSWLLNRGVLALAAKSLLRLEIGD